MSTSKNGVHILVFPYPAQGHMLPLLDFTHQLLLHGFKITILVTPKNLPILDPLLSTHPYVNTLVFPFPGHPSLPAGVENVKDVGNSGNCPIIVGLSKLHGPIMEWFKAQSNNDPPVAIVYDFFLGWAHDLAQEVGVHGIVFYITGALLVSILDNVWKNYGAYRDLGLVEFNGLPKSPRFVREHLPSVYLKLKEDDPTWEIVKNGFIANGRSFMSIFNTFEALEGEYLGFLKKEMGHDRVYSVGPINLVGGPGRIGKSNMDESVFTWLDECLDGSVLYVAFGSQKLLTKAQMEALTIGLEKSGVRFILVAKQLTAQQEEQGFGSVPVGFEERVSGRGVVIRGWAPQVEILGHQAVGGFLSHCGWNSVIEAIVAGVLILGWPMEADQFINAWLLVDSMETSVRVCEGSNTVPDPIELGRRISEAMSNNLLKQRAKKMKHEAYEAIKIGGTSKRDLDWIVRELAQLKN